MSSNTILITIIVAIIYTFNSVVNADEKLCINEGSIDLNTLTKDWWLIAFATENTNATVHCGRFSIYKYTVKNKNDNEFFGSWTSKKDSTSKEYIDITGHLNNYVAKIKGLYLGGESEFIDITMCNNNTQMIWKRSDPKTYLLLSLNSTGTEEIINKYKLIVNNNSLLFQTVNNTDCVH